jgi:hypothetical protein
MAAAGRMLRRDDPAPHLFRDSRKKRQFHVNVFWCRRATCLMRGESQGFPDFRA